MPPLTAKKNAFFQCLLVIGQIIAALQTTVVGERFRDELAVAMAIIQALLGLAAHYRYPDGTPIEASPRARAGKKPRGAPRESGKEGLTNADGSPPYAR